MISVIVSDKYQFICWPNKQSKMCGKLLDRQYNKSLTFHKKQREKLNKSLYSIIQMMNITIYHFNF